MKILIISFRFSPYNSIGTNRIIALVNFLKSKNIDYRVITSYVGKHGVKDFIRDNNVIYISWFDFRKFKRISSNYYRENIVKDQKKCSNIFFYINKILKFIKQFLSFFLYPDPYISWVFSALIKRERILGDFIPDIIYSSSYPYSSHLVAYFFLKKTEARWFAELRDPWVNNHLRKQNWKIIKFLDSYLSKKIFKKVHMIVTVSDIWKDEMSKHYKKKVLLIRNGFLIGNKEIEAGSIPSTFINSRKKKILYTGSVFPSYQNIDSFIQTFMSDKSLRKKYDFVYVGSDVGIIQQILNKYNFKEDTILLIGKVSSKTALWLQNNSDILLLFNWKDDRATSKGIIPGKYYEYLGANKPILLWNEGVNNELYKLSLRLNSSHSADKILIVNNKGNLLKQINNFVYDTDVTKIKYFSRDSQFNILFGYFIADN